MSLAPSSLDFSLSSTPNFSSAFGGGVKRPGFFGSLGNAISSNPVGFGLQIGKSAFDAFSTIRNRDLQRSQMNDSIDLNNLNQQIQYDNIEAGRNARNTFRAQGRMMQRRIADQYLLPGIKRNANLAYESALYADSQADMRDAFVRQNIMTRMMVNDGSTGSAGVGRSRNFNRGVNIQGGVQLGQLAETRTARKYGLQSNLQRIKQQADQAIVNVEAPLRMPLYHERGTARPALQQRLKKPANENLMIAGGALLGGLGNFFG